MTGDLSPLPGQIDSDSHGMLSVLEYHPMDE